MKGERIEAVMIVKNEEEVLGRCLDSLRGIDKVTILDTGSADGTGNVAARYADFVEYHRGKYRWNDNFAEARNEALKYATCEWILVIDADEVLVRNDQDAGQDSVANLRAAVDKAGPDDMALMFRCFSAGGDQEHLIVRAHRRRPEIRWCGAIHNYLSCQTGPLASGVLLVYGHSPAHNNDPDRAFRILSREVALNPDAPRETYYLAREYWSRRDLESARKLYERYLPMSRYAPEKADALVMLARIALLRGDVEDAYSRLFQALRINADMSEAYYLLAKISGPANKACWIRNASAAKNARCLFVRSADDMRIEAVSAGAPGAIAVDNHEVENPAYADPATEDMRPIVFNHL